MGERVSNFVVVVMVAFLAVSCGKNVPTGNAEFLGSNIIVGDVDWKEVTELSLSNPIRKSSKAVADVQFSNGGRCTGFLISNNVLMTNHHCIRSARDVVGMKVYMKHEKGVSRANYAEISCTEFIGNDQTLDFALVKCAGSPGTVYGKVELSTEEVVPGDDIYVVHQNCDYYTTRDCDWSKKFSEGKVSEILEREIAYNADTLGGSSGSPVFSADSDKVVAIHHAGYGGNWYGRGEKNMGVSMDKIVPFIQANFPEVLATGGSTGGDTGSDDGDDSSDDDQGTENDSFETATDLGTKKNIYSEVLSKNESDFYKFKMKSRQIMDVKVNFKHSKGDIDFKVYKKTSTGYKLVKTKESSTDNESIRMRVSSSATYFVKVYGYRGASNTYTLKFKKN